MSARADTDAAPRGDWGWLAPSLRPREQRASEQRGRVWRVETLVLLAVFALLATATINDLVRQAHINQRFVADLATWRAYTHHDFKNVGVDQETYGPATHRDVVCGNTEGGAPNSKTQICLVMTGPTRAGRRAVSGGWYLPAYTLEDLESVRYGCFGSVTMGRCPR